MQPLVIFISLPFDNGISNSFDLNILWAKETWQYIPYIFDKTCLFWKKLTELSDITNDDG